MVSGIRISDAIKFLKVNEKNNKHIYFGTGILAKRIFDIDYFLVMM